MSWSDFLGLLECLACNGAVLGLACARNITTFQYNISLSVSSVYHIMPLLVRFWGKAG